MKERTLEEFLSSLAAPKPTPGGGSAAALAGALSVALSRMVAGLARGKKGYEDVQEDLERLEARAAPIQARLETLVEEDAASYEAVLKALRLPRTSEAERAARVEAMQAAYREATKVPLETASRCLEALEIAALAAEKGFRGASTDVGVAVLLADAGLRGANLNVRANLASVRDETFRSEVEGRLAEIEGRAEGFRQRAMAVIQGRL